MPDPIQPSAKLSPVQKANWNKFIDFVAANKMQGAPILDQRNKQVGMSLLQKFNMTNPTQALPNDIVPKVQQELQDYRTNLVNQWKAGKASAMPGIKTEDDIMPNISTVDGWPGSKTLSHKFPVGTEVIKAPTGTVTTKNFGTDLDAYAKAGA